MALMQEYFDPIILIIALSIKIVININKFNSSIYLYLSIFLIMHLILFQLFKTIFHLMQKFQDFIKTISIKFKN